MVSDENRTRELQAATLEAGDGLRVTVLNYGATLRGLEVPGIDGPIDAVLSYPRDEDYLTDAFYLGSTVGPYANRIAGACFELDANTFDLEANEVPSGNCLHGGRTGLHQRVFDMQRDEQGLKVECHAHLADGAGGFPGNRSVSVVYQLLDEHTLAIDFSVETDRDTVVSLANHAYFSFGGPLAEHEIRILADEYTPVDDAMIPTGEIRSVAETEFDLRTLQALGDRQFDHNFVLSSTADGARPAAQLRLAATGVHMNMYTTQIGLQLYTGDYLVTPFAPRRGLCLEAQAFPDAPNQPGFPSARVAAGSRYWQRSIFEFSTIDL